MNKFEKRISQSILHQLEGHLLAATPSLRLQVIKNGRKKVDLQMGDEYKYYDLASLTKILLTTSAFVRAVGEKGLRLNRSLSDFKPDWPHEKVQIKDLLCHNVGLPWWNPYYKKLEKKPKGLKVRRDHLWELLKKEKPNFRAKKAVYSDLDFLLLGYALEEIYEKSLDQIWAELAGRLKMNRTGFSVNNRPRFSKKDYAPTERCPWRKKLLQGEVHDDNAWSLRGVSSHAGLFGPIEDVIAWGLELRKGYYSDLGSKLGNQKVIKSFCRRSVPASRGDWGLGFMKPTKGSASCGRHFGASSVGHTGFTGTSFWWDPAQDLMVVLLSHRVCPTRNNKTFVALRPKIHDWVWQALSQI